MLQSSELVRVLLTGNRGKVGRTVEDWLRRQGDEVVGFDLIDGYDMLDKRALDRRISGCRAVVHLAAHMPDEAVHATEMLEKNVSGTWNVLLAAQDAGIKRVAFASSVNALGIFRGESKPDYLPIDDDHPARPRTSYGLAKLLSEETCRYFTTRYGMTTLCLRLAEVWEPQDYTGNLAWWRTDLRKQWRPFWEYGAFIDVRDLADATSRALRVPLEGHVRLLLCSTDFATAGKTGHELAQQLLPDVEWRGGDAFVQQPRRALVDTRRAREVLGWSPYYTWQRFLESDEGRAIVSVPRPSPGPRGRLGLLLEKLGLKR